MVRRIEAFLKRGWDSQRLKARRLSLRKYGLVFILLAITSLGLVLLYPQDWAGFKGTKTEPAKTLWDWLELLGGLTVPIILALWAYRFDQQTKLREEAREEANRKRDIEREEANRQEEILQDYLDDMSQLLMEKGLKAALVQRNKVNKNASRDQSEGESQSEAPELSADEELPVIDVARARTISTLRRLKDPQRRNELLDFLGDAGLYKGETALLRGAKMDGINLVLAELNDFDLSEANLLGANLSQARLQGAHLEDAVLIGAILEGANLSGAHLQRAILTEANLQRATLGGGNLEKADLSRAVLRGASFKSDWVTADGSYSRTNLSGTWLMKAVLEGADLADADLRGANLSEAVLKGVQMRVPNRGDKDYLFQKLTGAAFDEKTILPYGGSWYEDVDWTQFTEPKSNKQQE